MWLALLFCLCGLATLGAALFFHEKGRRLVGAAVPTPLRAIGLEEQEGDNGIYYHLVYEIAEGPDAGRRVVSELGHGRRPKLPEGRQMELLHEETGKVLTAGALRFLRLLTLSVGCAGLFSLVIGLYLALGAQT